MRKKITLIFIVMIVMGALTVGYKSYGRAKAEDSIRLLKGFSAVGNRDKFTDDIRVEKIIKQTPSTLVVLVKWDDNEKMYLTINNWMGRHFETIEVDIVDKEKGGVIYE